MTQSKQRKEDSYGLVKLFQENIPGDFLSILETGIKAIIEAELNNRVGAQPYERSEERKTYRNGIRLRKKELTTSMGKVTIGIPKLRKAVFIQSF